MRNILCAVKKISMILLSIITLFFIIKTEALYAHAYDELTTKVDELFKEWDRNDSPGAALGIIRDGRIIYKRGYGMANLEHNIPIKPDSVFRIASISKQFFAAGIIILEQQGKISLDDDIRKYLPELHDYGHTVTIRHLIHHTGGIRDYLSLNRLAGRRIGKRRKDYFSMKDHMELMVRQKGLNFKPGEKLLYSNSGYVLLAEIIARVSGSSEADFLKKYIFDPLGMKNTIVRTDCDQIVKNRAIGYSPTPDGRYEIDITKDQTTGHDAVFTSVEDMFLWDQNFYNNKLGIDKEKFIKELLTPGRLNNGEKISYAAGLAIGEYRGLRDVSHDGAWAGYQAIYIQWPDQKFSIILFSNVGTFDPWSIAKKIVEIYLADVLEKPSSSRQQSEAELPQETKEKSLTLSITQLKEYVGRYYCYDLDATYTIIIENGGLILRRERVFDSLIAVAPDRFKWDSNEIEFARDSARTITGLHVQSYRVKNLFFKKVH